MLILELPSSEKDLGIVNVILIIPDDCPCPEGTRELKKEESKK